MTVDLCKRRIGPRLTIIFGTHPPGPAGSAEPQAS